MNTTPPKPDPALVAEVCAKNAPRLIRLAEGLQRILNNGDASK